jgi:cytochrome c-type protein NapB
MKKVWITIIALAAMAAAFDISNVHADEITVKSLKCCYGCHHPHFKGKALGKSKVVSDMNETAIYEALKGYKDGTYGGSMKGLMKGQVINYDDSQLKQMASLISKDK